MAWSDRLREAAYISPSGSRITFDYEDVSREVSKKTASFDFPDAEGSYIQDLGRTGRRYPLRVFFSGADCDRQADAFEAALLERGAGKLEHPLYGSVDVVPFGDIKQRDDLKTAANQSVIEVTFFETIGLIYPTGQRDPGSAVLFSLQEFISAAAAEFGLSSVLNSAIFLNDVRKSGEALIGIARDALLSVASVDAGVLSRFNLIFDAAKQALSFIDADNAETTAFQVFRFIESPARSSAPVSAKSGAYKSLLNTVTSEEVNASTVPDKQREANIFRLKDIFASAYIAGTVLSAVNHVFETKKGALTSAGEILDIFNDFNAWRESNFSALDITDTGEAYQALQETVALTAGYLTEISFTLLQERRVTASRARTAIDFCAELYGAVDNRLDYFINTNLLTGSEILEIPEGREIVYYV